MTLPPELVKEISKYVPYEIYIVNSAGFSTGCGEAIRTFTDLFSALKYALFVEYYIECHDRSTATMDEMFTIPIDPNREYTNRDCEYFANIIRNLTIDEQFIKSINFRWTHI